MGRNEALNKAPVPTPGHSLRSAAAMRAAGVLLLALVVIASAAILIVQHLNEVTARQKLDDAARYFRARTQSIEEGWQIQAEWMRSQLAFSRAMDATDEKLGRARFNVFVTSFGGAGTFRQVLLLRPDGTVLGSYGTHKDRPLALPRPLDASPVWVYGEQDRTLYRALSVPTMVHGEPARLLLYAPLDNALLLRMTFPDTRASLLWRGQVIAQSMPLNAADRPSGETLEVAQKLGWNESADSPDLSIHTRLRVPVTNRDLLLLVLATVVFIAALSWLVLGRWMGMQSRRIRVIERAVNLFSASQTLEGEVSARLQQAGPASGDELASLALGMRSMMGAIEEARGGLETSRIALFASERKYRSLVEQASDAIFLCSPDGSYLDMNQTGLDLLGYTREEVLKSGLHSFVPAEDLQAKPIQFERMRGGQPVLSERHLRRKDGRIIVVESRIRMLENGNLLGIARDVSERKKLENELLELNATLERRVAERTADLASVNAELTSANGELEAFSSAVSHDLRTPLRGIDGYSRLLQEEYADVLDNDGKRYVERVRLGTQRMGTLIDDLLKLSKVGRETLQLSPVDLSALAREVAAELQMSGQHTFTCRIQAGVSVTADPGLMRLVLENLLGNAVKYTGKTPDPMIAFAATAVGAGVEITIRDNGAGFDMAYADKLFQPFQRLHSEREFEGTGVGLATVARIVQRHGGHVRATAEPNRGSTFYIFLPKGKVQT
jgi:hypothetical protein